MSVIDQSQGAPKVSEIATDEAQALLATSSSEDLMTVLNQLRKVVTDTLRRSGGGFLLVSKNSVASSPGTVAWTGSQITFGANTDIVLKFIQNESGNIVDLVASYGASNTNTTFNSIPLSSGEVAYIELDRSLVPSSGSLVLQNGVAGSIVVGKTVKKSTAGPALISASSGATGTLSIPLAMNIDGHLWWIPHGIYWPPNTSSPLGAVVTSTSMPIGAIIPFHTFGVDQAYGYTGLKGLAPGFQLCDGSVIIDAQSPKCNPTRNQDGTPTLTYDPNLDYFTPNLNGEHADWSNAVTWKEGDYVINLGIRYVAIQDVPVGIAISNTSYWQTEATYNNTASNNAYNKYRKTTQNRGVNTYLRGNKTSAAASSALAYGGANTHTLTISELAAHTHTTDSQGSHIHTGSTSSQTPATHNHGGYTGTTGFGNVAPGGSVGYESGNDGSAAPSGNVGTDHRHTISSDGAHTHVLNIVSNGAHTHTALSTGGGAAHNNEPRYHNVLYIVRIF